MTGKGRWAWWVGAWALTLLMVDGHAAWGQATRPATRPAATQPAPVLGADGLPLRVQIKLRDVLWQPVPVQVRQVFIGPDGRVWHVMTPPAAPRWAGMQAPAVAPTDVAQAKRVVEREWGEQSPQVWWVRPALFEKGGRVWFITGDEKRLLGYAGRAGEWIERMAADERVFSGGSVVVGDQLLFADTDGIHGYDGRQWSYTALATSEKRQSPRDQWLPPVVVGEPGGTGAVAYMGDSTPALWSYRDGRWSELIVPEAGGMTYGQIALDGQRIYFHNTNSTWACRMPRAGAAALEKPVSQLSFGRHTVKAVSGLKSEGDGALLVSAGSISEGGRDLGPGIIVVPPGGDEKTVKAFLRQQLATSLELSATAGYRAGESVWVGGQTRAYPAARLSLADGSHQTLPDPNWAQLQAVAADGTVYSAYSPRPESGSCVELPVMVYRPGMSDDRKVVNAVSFETALGGFCVASDGAVWASDGGGRVVRFDGQRWEVMSTEVMRGIPAAFAAGRGDAVYVEGPRERGWQHLLFVGGKCHVDASLQSLVEAHAKEITEQFGASPQRVGAWRAPFCADKDGNVWTIEGSSMAVRVGQRWLDVREAIRALGPKYQGMQGAQRLCPLGDGSAVLVEWGQAMGKSLFIGSVRDGKIELKPVSLLSPVRWPQLRDAEGAVWLLESQGQTQRITPRGWERTGDWGRPEFVDAGGMVWLHKSGQCAEPLRVWGAGKVAEMSVPASGHHWPAYVSDKAGSVYVWTPVGLMHYVSRDGKAPEGFTCVETLHPRLAEGAIYNGATESKWPLAWPMEYSSLGYVVAGHVEFHQGQASYHVDLIPLPAGPAAGKAPPAATQAAAPQVTLPAQGKALPEPAAVKLGNEPKEVFPREVQAVATAPDGRIWCTLPSLPYIGHYERSAIKAMIEREFAKPAPQLWYLRPVLFEPPPSKRVWFFFVDTLLGYDGTSWIEHDAAGAKFLESAGISGVNNLAAAGALLFPNSRGVDVYSQGQWQRLTIPRPADDAQGVVWGAMAPSPDGQAVFAVMSWPRRELWRYAGGKWTSEPLPREQAFGSPMMGVLSASEVALLDTWARWRPGDVMVVRVGDGQAAADAFAKLRPKLGAEDFRTREQGTKELLALGQGVVPFVQDAMKDEKDAEVKRRLEDALKSLSEALARPWTLGAYQLEAVGAIVTNPGGTVIVSVEKGSLKGQAVSAGLLVSRPDGSQRYLTGREFTWGRHRNGVGVEFPVLGNDARFVGLPPVYAGVGEIQTMPARLVDLTDGSVLKAPEWTSRLFAVGLDGRLYVGTRAGLTAFQRGALVSAVTTRPAGPATRPVRGGGRAIP